MLVTWAHTRWMSVWLTLCSLETTSHSVLLWRTHSILYLFVYEIDPTCWSCWLTMFYLFCCCFFYLNELNWNAPTLHSFSHCLVSSTFLGLWAKKCVTSFHFLHETLPVIFVQHLQRWNVCFWQEEWFCVWLSCFGWRDIS